MKKEEITITFYAAECGEFHEMGEYTKCNSLEEAYKKYQKYCRTSANMCPAIEFSIHDPVLLIHISRLCKGVQASINKKFG